MPNLTTAAGDIVHSIVHLRHDRAEATSRRKKGVSDRTAAVASELHGLETSRRDISAQQRRRLATFMTDLTANVGSMRDGFRTGLESMRVTQRGELTSFVTSLTTDVETLLKGFGREIRTSDEVMHKKLDGYRRDRQGASDVWNGRTQTAKPPVAQRPAPAQPMNGGARPHVASAPMPPSTPAASSTPVHVPPHVPTPPHATTPSGGPGASGGSSAPTHGGKTS